MTLTMTSTTNSQLNATIVTIGPDLARYYLSKNKKNRLFNAKHVHFLANEIRTGNWKLNGDTIVLNDERLIDGQHRLMAVLMADLPITTLLVTGVSSDVFDTIDIGKKRTSADVLHIEGEKHTTVTAAALSLIEQIKTSQVDNGRIFNASASRVRDLLKKYPLIKRSADLFTGKTKYRMNRVMSPSIVVALHYLFSEIDAELADQFMSTVISGENMKKGDPEFALRTRLEFNAFSKAKLPKKHIVALVIKAWNFKRQNKITSHLNWRTVGDRPEAFPVIL
jgi:hypothetical protein